MKKVFFKRFWVMVAAMAVIGFMAGCKSPTNAEDDFADAPIYPGGGLVAVSSITGIPTSGTVGKLTLYGTVIPDNATNQTIAWSVVSAGTTGATISGNTLTTTAAGTVMVRATIVNGLAKEKNYTQNFTIIINPAGGNPSAITYTAVQTGGEDGETDSAGIVFTFSESVDNLELTAANINVSGAAAKGSAILTGSGMSRTLAPITVNEAGLAYVSIAKYGIEMGTRSVTVFKAGEMAPEYWSITWHLDGGTEGTNAHPPSQIVKDTILARPSPDPTKDDNTFGGWYADSDLTQEYNFTGRVTENLNLYAKWVVSSGEEVIIAMWDIFGDGWDNNAALRINVNGINRTTNARLTDGYGPGYHKFLVNAGDVVHIYWVNGGSNDTEIAFAVYYSDNPPSPEFNPSTGTTDTTRVLVSKRYNSSSWPVGNGTLMGSFTAVGGTDSEHWSITWRFNGGTAGTGTQHPTQIMKDTVLTSPFPDPTKDGYTFDGWYTDDGLTQTYNFANPVTWHLSLYAKWEDIPPAAGTTVPGDTLAEKLAWVKNADNVQDGENYVIAVNANEAISTHTLSYTNRSNITIILWGNGGERVVSLSQNGSLFSIGTGVTLVLERNITLRGHNNNYDSLVRINSGGDLIMNTGAKISGNRVSSSSSSSSTSSYGGGVYVSGNGTFTMNGGEISGNTASSSISGSSTGSSSNSYGGGVYVSENGIFTMNGGEISGNTASSTSSYSNYANSLKPYSHGGGIYVSKNGTFTIKGGKISDNTASSASNYTGSGYTSNNTYAYGGGIYMDENGTFTMEGGEISGNTVSATFTNRNEINTYSGYSYGGGIYMSENGTFTKSSGTIYGYSTSDTFSSNVVKRNGLVSDGYGHAVYVDNTKRRETTAGPGVNLDSNTDGTAGGWEK